MGDKIKHDSSHSSYNSSHSHSHNSSNRLSHKLAPVIYSRGQELVDLFDSNLELVQVFDARAANQEVYKVKSGDSYAIFKYGWQVKTEVFALKKLKNTIGFPQLYEFFDSREGENALLKEFIPGNDLSDVLSESHISDSEFEILLGELSHLLLRAHSKGCVLTDLKPANFIKSDASVSYVDLGMSLFKNNLSVKKFNQLCNHDFLWLKYKLTEFRKEN